MPTDLSKSPLFLSRERRIARAGSLALIGLAHGLLLWGLARSLHLRNIDAEAAPDPLFVEVLQPQRRAAPPDVVLPLPAPEPSWAPAAPPLPLPKIEATTPEAAAPRFSAVQAAPETPVAASPASPASAPPAAAQPERQIAITQVEYLTPPLLVYPLASRRLREQGQAQVRVRVDEQGRPQRVLLLRSTGSERLDEAALATVQATRFKPYTEDGRPRPFWVVMPLIFELDT